MKAALYARVSTSDKGQDVELQLKDMREYCLRMKYEVVEYVDIGESGAKESRPAFNKLMEDARLRRFDILIVWKLDRLSRSLKHLILTIEELKEKKIEFMSFMENIDTTTPAGKLMFHMIGSFAEFYRDIIRENVRAGMKNAKEKGIVIGRHERKVDVEEIMRLRAEKMSFPKIATKLNIPTTIVFRAFQKATKNSSVKNTENIPFQKDIF